MQTMSPSRAFVVTVMLTAVLTACSPVGLLNRAPDEHCSATFDPDKAGEPLGSNQRLLDVMAEAGSTPDVTTTLGALADSAGWSTRWDRVIQQVDGMTDEQIDTMAGTHGVCWRVPADPPSVGSTGHYIFLRGTHPVQAVLWDGGRTSVLNLPIGSAPHGISRTTILTSDPAADPRLQPQAPEGP